MPQQAMKLDSESPYHHPCPPQCPHKHDTKIIVHNDNPFIFAKDNHFIIDMLNIDEAALNEGKHVLRSPIESKSAKVTSPPEKYLNFEDSFNINKTDDESREAPYSAPSSGFEMVVKEDFYTDKIITEVELPELKVCIEEDQCHIGKDISIDRGVQSSDRSLVESDVGRMEPSISNQTLDNGHNDSSSEMASSAGPDDLKYTVCNTPLIIVDKDQADLTSVLHNDFDGRGSFVGSFDSGVKLHTTASAKITEIPADQASAFYNDSDGKGSSVSSLNAYGNLEATDSMVNNVSSEVNESPAVPASDVHNECNGKVSSVSSIYCGGMLDASEVTESPAVPASDVHNEYDGKGSSVSSIYCGGKLDTSESVSCNTSTEVTETSVIPASDVNNECVGKDSVSSIDSGLKLGTSESIATNISAEFTQSQLLSSQEITRDSLHEESSHLVFCIDQKQSVVGQKYKDVSEERNSGSTALSFPSEVEISALGNGSKEIPANCKVPSGVITFSFETDAASTSGRGENKVTTNNQQSEVAKNGPVGTNEGMIDGPAVSRCSFLHLVQGESNLSGPDFLSGPIANSGHMPYSGSISLRSDSSTTSARSFAFPILQSEWNSSPVKMAKADRHLRKHRGWRIGLLCCKF